MYRIKNWLEFQHYGDKRSPPWIKLHYELLTSETWIMIDDASKLLAIVCMLLASRNKGEIKGSPSYIQKVGNLNKLPNFKPLLDIGFIELIADASNMLADATDSLSYSSSISLSESKGGGGGGTKITLETLSIAHIEKWLSEKRASGVYIFHDENLILEGFKDYCRSKGKTYKDYPAALRGAFAWEKHQPKGNQNATNRPRNESFAERSARKQDDGIRAAAENLARKYSQDYADATGLSDHQALE